MGIYGGAACAIVPEGYTPTQYGARGFWVLVGIDLFGLNS